MKSQSEKTEAIKLLQIEKRNIPEYCMFGNPNHKAIDAQIQVIDEEMDEDSIITLWGDELDEDTEELSYVTQYALVALSWLNSEIELSDLVYVE